MLGYQLSKLVYKYLSFETRYNMDLVEDQALVPWVTLCNTRAFDILALERIYTELSRKKTLYNNCSQQQDSNYDKSNETEEPYEEFVTEFISFFKKISSAEQNVEWNTYHFNSFERRLLKKAMSKFNDVFIGETQATPSSWYEEKLIFILDKVWISSFTLYCLFSRLKWTIKRVLYQN